MNAAFTNNLEEFPLQLYSKRGKTKPNEDLQEQHIYSTRISTKNESSCAVRDGLAVTRRQYPLRPLA